MRNPLLLLAMVVLGVGCSQRVLTPVPVGDGYGPAGGGEHSGSSSGTGSSQTPPSDGNGSGSGGSGSGSSGGSSGSSSGSGSGSSGSGGSSGSSGSSSGGGSSGFDAGPPEAGVGNDAGASGDGGDVSALLPLCVSQINDFRSQNGEGPLTESTDLERYSGLAAASDAHNGQLHSYFYATGGGGGVATTEDELDGAKIAPAASAQQTMTQGLQSDEQANGGAAANLLDQQFSEVGCGFGQDPSGNWWVVVGLR